MDTPDFDAALTAHLTKQSRKWRPQVAVDAPGLGVNHRYGPQDLPFHSASVGKLACTALIVQLIEQGVLSPATPVAAILNPNLLRGIFQDDQLGKVTIEHLLTHTSGANDYLEGRTKGPNALAISVADPRHRWTPTSLLTHTREHQRPIGPPGRRFRYSDTGFVVLGLLLEAVTDMDYHQLVHDRILDPLGMTRSFMPRLTTPAVGDDTIAPLYLGRTRVDGAQSLTLDWAGGGLAGTMEDHLTLIRALRSGTLISRESWEWATRSRHRFRSGMHYGAGTMTIRFNEFVPWLRGWPRPVGHAGITAAHLWHDPVHDADIVINFGATAAMRASCITLIEIVGLLRRLTLTGVFSHSSTSAGPPSPKNG